MKGDNIAARLVALAVNVIRIVNELPDTPAGRHVAGQLLRCGTSPGANYGEARGAESRRDFVHKLGVSLKELHETGYWLQVVAGARLSHPFELPAVLQEVDELCRILAASKRTATENRGGKDHAKTNHAGSHDLSNR